MDFKWAVDEAVNMVINGGCPNLAAQTIMDAIAFAEQETINSYQYAKAGIKRLYGDKDSKKCETLCKIIDALIMDERNHSSSANAASSVLSGNKIPKPEEYTKTGGIKSDEYSV